MRTGFLLSAALLASSALPAANIITVTGSSGFGFSGTVVVEGWSQTVGYNHVTISAPLQDQTSGGPLSGVEGVAYLVNQIGPGTTAANNVAPPVSVSGLSAVFTNTTLWTGLTLPAGNYWIVWAPTNVISGATSMTPEGASTPNFTDTLGTGVATLGASQSNTVAGFPPASTLVVGGSDNMFITVTGTATAVNTTPAPSTLILVFIALLGLGTYGFTRRRGAFAR